MGDNVSNEPGRTDLNLEQDCSCCNGAGQVDMYGSGTPLVKCYTCYGTGKVPSEFGQKILDFVSRRLEFVSKPRIYG